MEIQTNKSLQAYNTLNIDVSAECFCAIRDINELVELTRMPAYQSALKTVLGGGSNLLLKCDLPGFVLHNEINGKQVLAETSAEVELQVGGGENWHELVTYCVQRGWGGIENLALIPGTAGAAPVQNIGAYGVELKDVLISVECVDLVSGEVCNFSQTECEFGYRDSVFKRHFRHRFLISSIRIRLQKNPSLKLNYGEIQQQLQQKNILAPTLRDVFNVICEIRSNKLPDPATLPNAGSFFKNPVVKLNDYLRLEQQYGVLPHYPAGEGRVKLAAGWLIEQAGWKGKALGPVRMYERQALVLVNEGGTGQEVLQLAEAVRDSVLTKFNVLLEIEPDVMPQP